MRMDGHRITLSIFKWGNILNAPLGTWIVPPLYETLINKKHNQPVNQRVDENVRQGMRTVRGYLHALEALIWIIRSKIAYLPWGTKMVTHPRTKK